MSLHQLLLNMGANISSGIMRINIQELSPFLVLYVRRSSTAATPSLNTKTYAMEKLLLLDFSLTVKAAPHECVIRTSQP